MTNYNKLQKEIQDYDQEREKIIKKSRDIIKLSKQIIYSVHRDELSEASILVKKIEKELEALKTIAKKSTKLSFEGSFKMAVQEYVEAILYYNFVKQGKLIDLKVSAEHFVLGLADLPGELVRRAVFLAGKREVEKVIKIKDEVDHLYGELLRFDFRDHEIRRKVDAVKYSLKKLEDLVLDLKLRLNNH